MTSLQVRGDRTVPLETVAGPAPAPVATVSANLLPPSLVARRRLGWLKRRLAFVVSLVLVLTALAYVWAQQQTSQSDDALAAEQQRTQQLTKQIGGYDDIVRMQGRTAALRTQLGAVMTGDLPWSTVLARLVAVAPTGLVVNQVDGEVVDPTGAGAPPAAGSYNPGGQQIVATIGLSGTAPDYRAVSRFLDALQKVAGVAQVDPGSVTAQGRHTDYTLTVSLTKAVLGGRFSGGK
ncbi:PilN domain-containing protein [Jatrophihabitans fulvus]